MFKRIVGRGVDHVCTKCRDGRKTEVWTYIRQQADSAANTEMPTISLLLYDSQILSALI